MKKFMFVLLLFLLYPSVILSHPWEPAAFVIIDTDGGLDDMRTITIMLADPSVQVVGIIASDGVLPARETYSKVKSLLKQFHHEGILTGINNNREVQPVRCKTAGAFHWGPEFTDTLPPLISITVISHIFHYLPEKITWVSLGSLTAAGDAITYIPGFVNHIREIIWSANGENLKDDFNYDLNPQAYREVASSGLPLKIVCGLPFRVLYDSTTLGIIRQIQNKYSEAILRNAEIAGKMDINHCDDLAALWLKDSSLYVVERPKKHISLYQSDPSVIKQIKKEIPIMLKGQKKTGTKVLAYLPLDPGSYREDIRPIVTGTIRKYGFEEWYAGVITGEFHRHLGIFAIIGVKMGIRAREYFDTGPDELKILSYAGSKPPVSCMNDGLQASTGATMGHGLIKVADNKTAQPVADFTYMGTTIRLALQDKYRKKIVSAVRNLKDTYGLESDEYWDRLRELTIKEWHILDRHNIFHITILKN